MRDHIIRAAFHKSILQTEHRAANIFVLDELGLKNGEIRADIAVLNGNLVGYEIKTERDTLKRLPAQVTAYSEVFDRAYIVTCEKHLKRISALIPDWWGIYLIESVNDGYQFEKFRKANYNSFKNSFAIAQLLWKGEVQEILTERLKLKVKQRQRKEELYRVLAVAYSVDELSQITLQYMKQRTAWRTGPSPLL